MSHQWGQCHGSGTKCSPRSRSTPPAQQSPSQNRCPHPQAGVWIWGLLTRLLKNFPGNPRQTDSHLRQVSVQYRERREGQAALRRPVTHHCHKLLLPCCEPMIPCLLLYPSDHSGERFLAPSFVPGPVLVFAMFSPFTPLRDCLLSLGEIEQRIQGLG